MPESIRAFIAVRVPAAEPLQAVLRPLAEMGGAVKPVAAGQLHVTLKFLGDIPPEQAPQIARIVEQSARGKPVVEARLTGIGAFPHARRPSVIWAGMEDAQTLADIAAELESQLKSLGFARERRAFRPHLTLARVRRKPPPALGELLQKHGATDFGPVRIEQVELFQSELRPEGARYTVLASAPLACS